MELFPAIDIRNGQVVRLTQGDYNEMEVYASDPLEIANTFKALGATNLHVVDLDGALEGELSNFEVISRIIKETGLAVQVGGGIRDQKRVEAYIDIGVARVILGTIAAENTAFVKEMVALYGNKIAVGVDAKDGMVAIKGWKEVTSLDSLSFCKELESVGVSTIIYTDIAKDGMMEGTNLAIYKTLSQQVFTNIIASGGISNSSELTELTKLGTYGAIIGKALYTGDISLKEAISQCK